MAGWPFAGRREELARLTRLAHESAVIIVGPAGTGKTRLASEVVRTFPSSDFVTARIRATRSSSQIPYGALAHLLPARSPDGHANPLRWAAEAISVRGRMLLLAIDDAHLLDTASAATVHYLVANAGAYLVATVRTGEAVPDGVGSLWEDGLAGRVVIGPLSRNDTAELLRARLGGPVDDTTLRRLYQATEGNALLLCELVTAALEADLLSEVRGMWRMDGVPPPSPRLTELIQDRIGALSPEQNAIVEYVALAEPLGLRPLTELCGRPALEEAERRGLIRIVPDERRTDIRLAHPLYGEVARVLCPPLRRRGRFTELARVVERYGSRRRDDPLRLTLWRVEGGHQAEPEPLIHACRLAWAVHDYTLAIRLGQLAVAAGGGIQAGLLLATVTDNAQLPDEALAVLSALPEPADEDLRRQVVLAKAGNLAWGVNRLDDALDLLDPTDPVLAGRRLSLLASAARPAETLELARTLRTLPLRGADAMGGGALRGQVLSAEALALCQSGRTGEAVALVREALADPGWREGAPALVSSLHSTWAMAGLFAGDLAIMREALDSFEAAAADQFGWSRGEGSLALARGSLAMARGEPRTALRVLHAAAHHTTATTVGGCMGAYASALAMLGDGVAAAAALAEARRRNRPTWTAFTRWAMLTEITIAGTSGERSRALSLAWSAVADARGAGLPGFEFLAFHELVRLGGVTPAVVDRLAALAAVHKGVRVRLVHEQAEQAGCGEGLLKVADGYAEAGFTLFAAEATAQAAGAFRRAGSTRQGLDAETRAWALAARCQGADTPPLRGLAAPQLTPRQRQIVRLVAAGHSNREIAERLFLSKRTVDNHLVAIYERTGIQDRAGLIRLHEILT